MKASTAAAPVASTLARVVSKWVLLGTTIPGPAKTENGILSAALMGRQYVAEGEQVGYLGHRTCIYPELSGLENLFFWARLHVLKPGRAALLELMERLGLLPFADERAGIYSRGMAQRLNLARVLLFRPALLLLDEPATGLDARSRQTLEEEIARAGKAGAGIVWISHRPEEDAAMADEVALLENGRLSLRPAKAAA